MTKIEWTEEEDNTVRSMFSERKTALQVADVLGRTRNAVLGRAYRLGLSREKQKIKDNKPKKRKLGRPSGPRLDPVKLRDLLIEQGVDQVLRDAREIGMSWAAIGRHLDIGYQTVLKYAGLLNIYEPVPQSKMTDEDVKTIVDDWRNYVPIEETADKIGRSFGVVRQKVLSLQKAGLISGRQAAGVRIYKRYGREALLDGQDPTEVLKKLNEAKRQAFSAALNFSRRVKRQKHEEAIQKMKDEIAAGVARNVAIFNCRASGVHLEMIAQEFGFTRERVRQICNAVAEEMAVHTFFKDLSPEPENKEEEQ